MKKIILSLSFAVLSSTLAGCGGIIFGGAVVATGVALSTAHDRRTAGRVVDDKTLEVKITRVLLSDNYIDENSHTNLTIFNGVVLITGEAATANIKQKILEKTQTVPGVKRIESDIAIAEKSSLYNRSKDSAITAKVKLALLTLDIPNFDATLVNVSTERGNVYIMGIVTREEADAMINKAKLVSGVLSVTKVFEYLN